MFRRIAAQTATAAFVLAVATTLVAPPANAQITVNQFDITQVGTSFTIVYSLTSDALPITCRWSARDEDQFGSLRAGGRFHNSNPAEFSTTVGPYPSGHKVRIEVLCRDRSGWNVHSIYNFIV